MCAAGTEAIFAVSLILDPVNLGCGEILFILIVIGVPAAVVLLAVYAARSTARKHAEDTAARRARGERITDLLAGLGTGAIDPDVQRELYKLLHEPPVGDLPEVIAAGGWFERVVPVLSKLAKTDSGGRVVTAYFRCFTFVRVIRRERSSSWRDCSWKTPRTPGSWLYSMMPLQVFWRRRLPRKRDGCTTECSRRCEMSAAVP